MHPVESCSDVWIQQAQHRFYSDKLEQLHSIVFQTDIADQVCHVPPVDNIRYGQAIDTERDSKDAIDDTSVNVNEYLSHVTANI